MRRIILSIDHEIFGNGTGDVIQHMIEPMRRMAAIAERNHVPLTIFLEVEEYIAFEKYAPQLRKDLGYDPAEAIREQVAHLAARGHDFQLHIHPEWVGCRYENKEWTLRPEINTVDQLFETQAETTHYIADRKAVVERLARAGAPGHTVRAYRAGAFSAQPGTKLLAALQANGIVIDSSVVKGLHHRNGSILLDYRSAPDAKGPWRVNLDVIQPESAGTIWEFPIYAKMGRRVQQATFTRLRAKFSKHVPKVQQKRLVKSMGAGKNPVKWMQFLLQPVPIKLDFHNMAAGQMLRWVRSAPAPNGNLPDIVVLIGHSKEHVRDDEFDTLVTKIAQSGTVEITTFDAVATGLQSLN